MEVKLFLYTNEIFKRKFLIGFVALTFFSTTTQAQVYKNPKMPVERRVDDLMKRMTLKEKVYQMTMTKLSDFPRSSAYYGVCESPFNNLITVARQSISAKKYARKHLRLGIPPIQIAECLHGVLATGATVFPQAIAQGSTWNPALIQKMGEAIAKEASTLGVDQALSPLFDLIRDPRYGRNEECFAEDPYLVGSLGTAFVVGMQGNPSETKYKIPEGHVMCTAKHFAAYSIPASGINLGPSSLGERELRSDFLPPFEMAAKKANIYSLMPSYNELDGIPAHANQFLLTTVLRNEWQFKGYVFSDYGGVSMLKDFHKIAPDKKTAAVQAVKAGVDLEAPSADYYLTLINQVKSGKLPIRYIDNAVRRILTAKFKAGVFDKPLADTTRITQNIHTSEHIALSKKIADESIILLQNKDNILPLRKEAIRSIAVIGPNADQVEYGDYSYTRNNNSGITVLKGIGNLVGSDVKINYAKGCSISGLDKSGFNQALTAARNSDAVVVVAGETSSVLSGIGWSGKVGEGEPTDPYVCGEGFDRSSIKLPGLQSQLLDLLKKEGKPIILVLINGRPLDLSWEKQNMHSIIEAWYPGEQGGQSVADILFGKVNPSGRLNVSLPQSVGHIPSNYDHKPSAKGYYKQPGTLEKPGRDYVFSSPDPLFPFGFGLSYTTFTYSDMTVSKTTFRKEPFKVSVTVKNTGDREGKEVVQLYVRDKFSSVTTPVKALKRFQKIDLAPGKSQTVSFTLSYKDFSLWNQNMKQVTEPGDFDLMIGKSSDDIQFTKTVTYKE